MSRVQCLWCSPGSVVQSPTMQLETFGSPEGPSTPYLRLLVRAPYRYWALVPERSSIGNLDPLGSSAASGCWRARIIVGSPVVPFCPFSGPGFWNKNGTMVTKGLLPGPAIGALCASTEAMLGVEPSTCLSPALPSDRTHCTVVCKILFRVPKRHQSHLWQSED